MRTPIIAANWKMHKTGAETQAFISQLVSNIPHSLTQIFIAPPFTSLIPAVQAAAGSKIVIGAQNMHEEEAGAFTGEISARMLKDVGARFVIVGHSERRRLYQETNGQINQKVKRALASGLLPLLCIGETQEDRDRQKTEEVLAFQLYACLSHIPPSDLVIAYEPVWAIGTGKTATPSLAQEAHAFCRHHLEKMWGKSFAERTNILYGGSVTAQTAPALFAEPDIDGALIGGASLDVDPFSQIIRGLQP